MTENESATSADPPHSADVGAAPQRLQDLLRATTSIVERLDLDVVLRRIVEAGMRLVGARYGALGVIGPDGDLERFVHVGVPAADAARIGHPPTGRGVLGAVIAEHAPIRLEHLSRDPRAVGFPAHHPAMDSFLGVPVRVGDQVYGNLYLAEGEHGAFSDADQEIIVALAATAGIAIENARLYDTARTRESWNATIADVMAAMLDVSGDHVLDVIAERVSALIDADFVAVARPHGTDDLVLSHVHGAAETDLRGRAFPVQGTLLERALATRRAVSVPALAPASVFAGGPDLGPTVGIPLFAGDEALGVLMISRGIDSTAFTDADLEMAFTFAAQASIALEVVRAREDRRRQETARDRSRIARDLHDRVIQRLFGAGLSLQAISADVAAPAASAIESQIDVIDETIKDIRTIVFALGAGERRGTRQLRDRVLDVISEVTDTWSVPPRITFVGALDSIVAEDLADDLVTVLRELLTNVAKHASARVVEVAVRADDGDVELVVQDDGRGLGTSTRRSGLANVLERAAQRDGACTIAPAPAGGTVVAWRVPSTTTTGPTP